jgi:CheY-like chemotaxis protein
MLAVKREDEPAATTVSPPRRVPSQHYNVLCVDDNVELLEILHARLTNAGYDTEVASNGFRALAKIRHKLDKYSLVVLDLRMPGLDGIGVIEQARMAGFAGQFVIFAGSVQPDQRSRLAELGVYRVIDKPGVNGELVNAIRETQHGF